jgi:3',5'-cyclic AMP phosphodiesterase CpdA
MSVAYRTDVRQLETVAEIAPALGGPGLEHVAQEVIGGPNMPHVAQSGWARYHHIRFEQLQPGMLYAYRVKGADGWSEWQQFRTAASGAEPFTFIYVGDLQNRILGQGARVIREAFRHAPGARLILHAGDLVNLAKNEDCREDSDISYDKNVKINSDYDDEWGRWVMAGGFLYGMTANVPVAGNHEYLVSNDQAGKRIYTRSPHWDMQFALPSNGVQDGPAKPTTYYFDYQGVRFIVLDSSLAVYKKDDTFPALAEQTAWLSGVLASNPHRWTIVSFHHPVFPTGRARDLPVLAEHWKPLFDQHGVDLVLTGHDHSYGRKSTAQPTRQNSGAGPVYVVSVAGPKMYGVTAKARAEQNRIGESTQLFQIIAVDGLTLRFEARTANGSLYDAFDIVKTDDGGKRVEDRTQSAIPARTCMTLSKDADKEARISPDGAPCPFKPR